MLKKIIFVSLILIIQIQNIYSQGTWFNQNPYPLGQNLNEVKFVNQNTGIACGDNGAIIRTTNGGLNWNLQYLPDRNNLTAICFTNQLTGFIVPGYTPGNLITPYIQKTTNGGLNWVGKNTGVSTRYTQIYFVNENTGYACGELGSTNGTVVKTTNSGETWSINLSYLSSFYDISFPNENTGYLLGNNSTIIKTTNSGLNWFEVTRVPVNNAESIFFTDSLTGYGVGGYPGFYKTTDGGMNWFSQGYFDGKQIYFINYNKGWVVGDAGEIHLTTNGGNNWYYFTSGTYIQSNAINFGDESTGYIVGNTGRILKTNVGGFIWSLISSSIADSYLFGVSFANTSTGIVAGSSGKLLRTTDSGNNWVSSTLISGYNLGNIKFVNESTGYLSADSMIWRGKLYKTIDAGISWNLVYSVTSNYVTSEYFTDPENGFLSTTYALNNSGKILKTTNGGSTWQEVFNLNTAGLKGLCFVNSNTGFCCGNGIIYKTTDEGNNWSTDVPISVNNFFFPSSHAGYAVGTSGSVYKTTDNGNNWSLLNTGVSSTYNMTNIYFINDNTGYVIGNTPNPVITSVIIKTTNGGAQWTIIDSNHYVGLYGITFSNSVFGYIVGYNGTILRTTDGGLTFANSNEEELPKDFYLSQNYPNPFNPVTNLEFGISNLGFVSLKIYDLVGKEVATIVNENLNSGTYKYKFDGSNLSSGVYFYKLVSGDFNAVKRMVLIK